MAMAADDRSTAASVCAGCGHEFKSGDHYIEDSCSGFLGETPDPVVDDIIAGIFGAEKVRLCEACIEDGGEYVPLVFAEAS